MTNIQVIAQLKREEKNKYLNILSEKNFTVCGGNQGWWEPAAPKTKIRDFTRFRKEKDFRMARLGCGVIAMCDLQCYLTKETGLTEAQYREYVKAEAEGRYRIGGDLFHYITGLTPHCMVKGFRNFANQNGLQFLKVKWAPFWIDRDSAETTLYFIREMLQADIPVVCSYHTFKKNGRLALYATPEEAAGLVPGGARQYIDSHYMTIVGVCKLRESTPDEPTAGEHKDNPKALDRALPGYVLEVVSWGSIYYVSYEDYGRHLSYFSNILKILP